MPIKPDRTIELESYNLNDPDKDRKEYDKDGNLVIFDAVESLKSLRQAVEREISAFLPTPDTNPFTMRFGMKEDAAEQVAFVNDFCAASTWKCEWPDDLTIKRMAETYDDHITVLMLTKPTRDAPDGVLKGWLAFNVASPRHTETGAFILSLDLIEGNAKRNLLIRATSGIPICKAMIAEGYYYNITPGSNADALFNLLRNFDAPIGTIQEKPDSEKIKTRIDLAQLLAYYKTVI